MPDHAKEPSEKQKAQDSALIELLIALANRRGPDSRGRSRLSRSLQRGETGRCAIATSRGSSATAQITVAWRLPTPNGTFGGVNPARLVTSCASRRSDPRSARTRVLRSSRNSSPTGTLPTARPAGSLASSTPRTPSRCRSSSRLPTGSIRVPCISPGSALRSQVTSGSRRSSTVPVGPRRPGSGRRGMGGRLHDRPRAPGRPLGARAYVARRRRARRELGITGALSFMLAGLLNGWLGWRGAFAGAAVAAASAWLIVWLGAPAAQRRNVVPPVDALFEFRPVLSNRLAMAYAAAYSAHTWEMNALRGWAVAFLVYV